MNHIAFVAVYIPIWLNSNDDPEKLQNFINSVYIPIWLNSNDENGNLVAYKTFLFTFQYG